MVAVLLAIVPDVGDPRAWGEWGLAGLVVGFTCFRDWQREKAMRELMASDQRWVRTTLIGALQRNTAVLEKTEQRVGIRD